MTGPYLVKDMVKGYSHRKNWPILFCCLNTGALHIELEPRQDTSAFLLCWEAFKAAGGIPSDKGLQPDQFCQLHRGSYGHLELEKIRRFTARTGTKWRFAPSGAQWRDGLSESRVKMLKEPLEHLFSGGDYTKYEDFKGKYTHRMKFDNMQFGSWRRKSRCWT